MRESKKRRLKAKGWRTGSAAEFLDLSPAESALVELKVRLARSVRDRRTHQHLTQVEVAQLIRSSQSRVAKMEAGDPSVSIDLLVRSLIALGVDRQELGRIISRESDGGSEAA